MRCYHSRYSGPDSPAQSTEQESRFIFWKEKHLDLTFKMDTFNKLNLFPDKWFKKYSKKEGAMSSALDTGIT